MSSIIRNILALSAVAAVAVAQDPAPKLDAPCADAVIFMARGNNAPYHDWRTFPFADATCAKLRAEGKTCDYIEVVFPKGGDYCPQIEQGVRNGIAQITAFNKKCPCTHLILNGYSQGAWIMGDVLAGPGGCSQFTTGLDPTSAPGNAIAAALLWGDVMHVANQPYNVLDGSGLQKDGRHGSSLARLNKYASVLRSYCSKGDPICANGDDVSKHLSYFEKYTDDASTWAVGKVNAAAPLCAAPTPTPSASSTPEASSVGVAAISTSSAAASSGSAAASGSAASGSAAPSGSAASSGYAAASGYAASYGAAASSTSPALPPYPTSPVYVAPFTAPQKYDDMCLTRIKIKYVYA
ncbi:carbohydrate esterase family 5 protein [Bipolaris zeicola 26-R-13]|uniref:Carbohydrate esterase family 5 protein n=1 Tax=Cochliobolus carbonum (strain 26-R-13) TaxID=930089 RepID=W6Y4A3_COCC2|nr:carbohydrate esterase family 5 protein [Bipolaris zeicola 26-R-13]EUC32713.1 carbohydrate esterase family 5 protein [Bipolaris zeicola 26-R-13]